MARINHGILSCISGSLGNLVFYKLNGKTVVRQKPGPRKYVPSEQQLFQQKSFAAAQKFLTPLRTILNQIHGPKRAGVGGMNATLSWLLKHAVENHEGTPVLIPEKIFLHRGYLTHLDDLTIERLKDNKVQITWSVYLPTDFWIEHEQFHAFAYVPELELVFWLKEGNFRKSGKQLIQLPWTQSHSGQVLIFG